MSLGKMFSNMRNAYAPSADHATLRPDGQGAEHYEAPPVTDPVEQHIPHEPEDTAQQEIRLALTPIQESIEKMVAFASIMQQALENVQRIYAAPIYEAAVLSSTNHVYVVADHKRNHVACFVAAAQTITVLIPGVGAGISFNLSAGWNQLDFPAMSEISTAGTAFNALFLYSMDRIANA